MGSRALQTPLRQSLAVLGAQREGNEETGANVGVTGRGGGGALRKGLCGLRTGRWEGTRQVKGHRATAQPLQTPRSGKKLVEFEEQNEDPGAGAHRPGRSSDGVLGMKGNQQVVPEQGSHPIGASGAFHGSRLCRHGGQAGAQGKENEGQEMDMVRRWTGVGGIPEIGTPGAAEGRKGGREKRQNQRGLQAFQALCQVPQAFCGARSHPVGYEPFCQVCN